MSSSPLFFAGYRLEPYQITPGMTTNPRIIFRPGSAGSQVFNVSIADTVAGAETVQFYLARKLTSSANMGAGQIFDNGASPDQVNRTAGDFTQDGWRTGNRMLVQDATTLGNDIVDVISAVSPTQIQLKAGGGTVAGTETFGPGANSVTAQIPALYRLHALANVAVPSNSGTGAAVTAVKGLDRSVNLPILLPDPDSWLQLGPTDFLCAAVSSTLTGTATLDLVVHAGDY